MSFLSPLMRLGLVALVAVAVVLQVVLVAPVCPAVLVVMVRRLTYFKLGQLRPSAPISLFVQPHPHDLQRGHPPP